MNTRELKSTFKFKQAEGVYLEFTTVIEEHLSPKGEVINQEVINRCVQGEGVPEGIIEAYAIWWRDGFPEPTPEKIEQYLHSVSAGHLLNFF